MMLYTEANFSHLLGQSAQSTRPMLARACVSGAETTPKGNDVIGNK